jgi:hypothetical protein
MLDFTKLPLHDILAMAAHKARANMGEGRAHVHFQDLLEACAEFAAAHDKGDEMGMFNASGAVFNAADEFSAAVEEPDAPDAGWDEERRVFETARAL